MKHKMFLIVAALVLLFAQKIWAEPDFDPEVIWESKSPVTFNILKFSPDDRYFYTRNDQGIHKFNSENGEYMGMYVEGYFNEFAFVEEYNWLVCASLEGLEIRDVQTGDILKVLSQDTAILHFDISKDNKRIVFTQGSELVDGNYIPLNMYVYSLLDFQEISKLKGTGVILQTKFTDTAEEVVLVSYYGDKNYPVQIYSIPEKKYTKNITVLNEFFQFMKISPDWKQVITVSTSNVNFYDIETGELRNNIPFHQAYIFGLNPTGQYYTICGSIQNSIYNIENHKELFKISSEDYRFVQFLNKNNKRLFAGRFNKIKMLQFDFDSLSTGIEIKEDIPVIYPNPSNDYVIIPIKDGIISNVTITDYTGRNFPAVYSIETNKKSDSIRIDLTAVPHGTYLITIQNNNSLKTYKLIKGE